jgi:hypothetical protein
MHLFLTLGSTFHVRGGFMKLKGVVKLILMFVAVMALLVACGDDPAAPSSLKLYGVTNGPAEAPTAGTLLELDPATGAVIRTIGPTGYIINGLTYDHSTNTLYASTSTKDPLLKNGLLTINTTTGVGTPVAGTFGGADTPVVCVTANAAGQLFGWNEGQDDLCTIDKATGLQTIVGNATISTSGQGLAFDGAGVLWIVMDGGIYTVNTTTGLATPAGSIGVMAHHGQFNPKTGLYWGIDTTAAGPKNIVVANLTTATVTTTLPTDANLFALAFGR